MNQLALFCLCIVGTNSFVSYPRGPALFGNGRVLSRREDAEVTKQTKESQVTSQDVYKAIGDLIVSARKGINASDLGDVAASIEGLTEPLSSNEVTGEDVKSLLKEIAAERGIDTSSNIFNDPISESENNLDALFRLLQGLKKRGEKLEESDKANKIIIAAVRLVARSIQKTVINFVGYVSFVEANNEEGKIKSARSWDIAKRDQKRQYGFTVRPTFNNRFPGIFVVTSKPNPWDLKVNFNNNNGFGVNLDATRKLNKWNLHGGLNYNSGLGGYLGATYKGNFLNVKGTLGYGPGGFIPAVGVTIPIGR